MGKTIRLRFIALAAAFLLQAACDSGPTEPRFADLRVRVLDYLNDDAPVPDVPCVFTKPGGERFETRSNDLGRMLVTGVDWSLGTLDLVCLTTDAYALLELGEDDVFDGYIALYVTVESPPASSTIVVSGSVENRATTESSLVVQSSHGLETSEQVGNTFELSVLRGQPFDLFAFEVGDFEAGSRTSSRELFGWAMENAGAFSTDVAVDLDFASPAEVTTRVGKIGLPSNDDSAFLGAEAFGDAVVVRREDLDIYVGLAVSTDHSGSRFDCEVQSLELMAPAGDVYTRYSIFADRSDDSARTSVLMDGLPNDHTSEEFLDAPVVIAPTQAVPYEGAEIEWSPDAEPPTALHVCDADGHCLYAYWPADVTSVRLPELPGELWNTGEALFGYLLVQDGRTIDDQYFRRFAHAKVLTLTQ